MRLLHLILAACAGMAAQGASAQGEPRVLSADSAAPWTHELSGIALPASAAGLVRAEIRDYGAGELDVYAHYTDPKRDMFAFVNVYRSGLPDVAIWFDRAAWAMRSAPSHGLESAVLPDPTPFARPGAAAPGGLRLAMDTPGPGFRSMAIAVAPLGNWLVKIRMSSRGLDRAALDAKLDLLIGALGWPAEKGRPAAAAAILPCPSPLRTRPARIVRDDIGQMLINSVAGIALEREGPAPLFCREPGLPAEVGVYRAGADQKSYVFAIEDNGIAYAVGPALSLDALIGGRRSGHFSMTRLDRNGTSIFPSFNRLPPPPQAIAVARSASPAMSTTEPVKAGE